MQLNLNISYEEESIMNLAFIKALLIKHNIECLNINYIQKEAIHKQILEKLKKVDTTEKEGTLYEK